MQQDEDLGIQLALSQWAASWTVRVKDPPWTVRQKLPAKDGRAAKWMEAGCLTSRDVIGDLAQSPLISLFFVGEE